MSKHHHFNYVEFPATDLAEMKRFYGAAFGWSFQDWGDAYVSIHDAGVDGGFDASGSRNPTDRGALVILYSDDLEASEKAVTDAGGKISMPAIDFPGGRRFHFTDPSGNELGIWTMVNEE